MSKLIISITMLPDSMSKAKYEKKEEMKMDLVRDIESVKNDKINKKQNLTKKRN